MLTSRKENSYKSKLDEILLKERITAKQVCEWIDQNKVDSIREAYICNIRDKKIVNCKVSTYSKIVDAINALKITKDKQYNITDIMEVNVLGFNDEK